MSEIFLKILSMSMTASLAALAVLLVRLALKKVPKIFSYLLWAVVFFRLLCPFSFELPAELLGLGRVTVTASDKPSEQILYRSDDSFGNTEIVINVSEMETALGNGVEDGVASRKKSTVNAETVLNIFGYLWLAGAAAMALKGLFDYFRLKKRLADAEFDGRAYLSDNTASPFIMGIFKPRIYLPRGLDEKRREFILRHETAHIRRGDHIAKLVMFAALCVHWFNPVVWLCFGLCVNDMEMSCDERAAADLSLSAKADYSQALLDISAPKSSYFTAGFGENGVKQRIKNILSFKKPGVWVMILCAAAVAFVLIMLATDRKSESGGNVNNGNGGNVGNTAEMQTETAAKAEMKSETKMETKMQTETVLEMPKEIQVVPLAAERAAEAFSEPWIVYADYLETVFTDGNGGLYFCSGNSVRFAADITATLEAAGLEDIDMKSIVFGMPDTVEDGFSFMCLSFANPENGKTVTYEVNVTGSTVMLADLRCVLTITENVDIVPLYERNYTEIRNGVTEYHYDTFDDSEYKFIRLYDKDKISIVRYDKDAEKEFVFEPFPEGSVTGDGLRDKVRYGVYTSEEGEFPATLSVNQWGGGAFWYSFVQSTIPSGVCTIEDDRLLLHMGDGEYVFEIDGEKLVFRCDKDFEEQFDGLTVKDGTVFRPMGG